MSVILLKTTTLLTSPLLLGFFAASTGLCLNVTIGEDSSTHEVTGCVDITVQGSYRLFTNITGLQDGKDYCIGITASNVVVDGAGYSLTGAGVGIGIYVIDGFNITLMNLYISSYHCGIDLLGPVYASIFNNTLTGINGEGLRLLDSNYNKLFYNTFMNISGEAVSLVDSDNNTVNHNLIAYSKTGIYLDSSDNNKILNDSVFNASEQSVYLWGSRDNLIYNNLFNSTTNWAISVTYYNDWNASLQPGVNIIGGSLMGGNAWFNPDGFGFSETCGDGDRDGVCDTPFVLEENNIDYLPLKYVETLLTTTLTTPTPTLITFTTTTLETTTPYSTTTLHETATSPLPLSGEGGSDRSVIIVVAVATASTALIILYASRKRRSSGH
ncbi:MAG: NosD domain-containing protein [Thermosphaera sp.]